MELVLIALLWPLILLAVGFSFISLFDVGSQFLLVPGILLFIVMVLAMKENISGLPASSDDRVRLEQMRRSMIAFSIALFLPIFMRYLLATSAYTLPAVVLGLFLSFGVFIWGIFGGRNQVLATGNILGGLFSIIYLYGQLWSLGELSRIVAAAFGLVVAIIISVIKFRDKLS
jgi:hypothetical protein